jgi:hypothetical protein
MGDLLPGKEQVKTGLKRATILPKGEDDINHTLGYWLDTAAQYITSENK